MYPVHDVDAILLLALSLASKRRPAELVEIIAAAELNHDAIPGELKLVDSFCRLSEYGLIVEVDGGYTLTPEAEAIVSGQRRSTSAEMRIPRIKENLADHNRNGDHPIILLDEKRVAAAILAHRASTNSGKRSLLVPKPKPAVPNNKRPPQRFPARKHKH